jgi:glycine cleavage system H protein
MDLPKDLRYSASHEWVKVIDGDKVKIGLTDYAQAQLGDIVYVNLPDVEDEFAAEDVLTDVESVKAVSDVISPVGGVVTAVNEALSDAPEMINSAPYEAWIVELSGVSEDDLNNLLDADAYAKLCN